MLRPIFSHLRHVSKLQISLRSCNELLNVRNQFSSQSTETKEVSVKQKIKLGRPNITKWKRPPFVKDFFLGKYDVELLAFPEVLNNELLNELEQTVKSIQDFFKEKVNSSEIDKNREVSTEILQYLKDLGLFGRTIPVNYGGLGLTYTASTRINEIIGLDWSIPTILAAHEFFASQVILLEGTEEQKNRLLPELASGRRIAALCATEFKSGSDLFSIESTASQNIESSSFTLNGSKSWVTNAELADYFIVFAKTANPIVSEGPQISTFLVERSSDGVIIEPYEKTSLHGVKTAVVHFKETQVPGSNVLGSLGMGFEIYLKAQSSIRFAMNTFTFGILKSFLDSVTEYIINTERFERSLGDVQLVRERLSKINTRIYAMESISYFTAAILDSSESPDTALETAIVKVFNSEGTLYCLNELMEVVGSSSFIKDGHLERFYKDAQAIALFDGPNDIARLFVAFTGCKHVGITKAVAVEKMRNPAFFPKDMLKMGMKRARVFFGTVKYDQDLGGHVHPSLVEAANQLEECVQKFEYAVEQVFVENGDKIVDIQLDPKKMADVIIDLYVMSAILSRSSRSYCNGLRNADHEVRIAASFCADAKKRIFSILDDLFKGPSRNNDGNNLILGEQIIDCRGYFPEHPLKHNF